MIVSRHPASASIQEASNVEDETARRSVEGFSPRAGLYDGHQERDDMVEHFSGVDWSSLGDLDTNVVGALFDQRSAGFFVGVALGLMLRPELFAEVQR